MNVFEKITSAYKSFFNKNTNDEDEIGEAEEHTINLDEMEELVADDQTSLLMGLNPEMRDYIINSSKNNKKTTWIPPKILPLSMLTDSSVATDIIALLGMIRWAMEKSADDGNKEYEFKVKCKNRMKSPLMISIGDIAIEPIPLQDEYHIGN